MRLHQDKARRIEDELARIGSVGFAQINLAENNEIESVDLVADRTRLAKSIVRDAEIIFRKHEVPVDHKKIGVAQLDSAENFRPRSEAKTIDFSSVRPNPAGPTTPAVLEVVDEVDRVRLLAVHSTTRGGELSAEVELALGDFEGMPGRAAGPAQDDVAAVTVVAAATLSAVRNLLQPGYAALVREVRVQEMGGAQMICVVVDFGHGRQVRRLVGACLDQGSLYDTAVYATLDAINRPLGRAEYARLSVLEGMEESAPAPPRAASA